MVGIAENPINLSKEVPALQTKIILDEGIARAIAIP